MIKIGNLAFNPAHIITIKPDQFGLVRVHCTDNRSFKVNLTLDQLLEMINEHANANANAVRAAINERYSAADRSKLDAATKYERESYEREFAAACKQVADIRAEYRKQNGPFPQGEAINDLG